MSVEESNAERSGTALQEFKRLLVHLPDPRRKQGQRYPLESVMIIALMAMVCGADDAEALSLWGEANEPWLSEFLSLPHGTPSQDVFLAVFASLDPKAFSRLFIAWMEVLRARLDAMGRHIAVDGKTSRRSHDRTNDRPAVHTVSAWLSEEGLVLGQCKTREKSNEITAIPELLQMLDIRGATITIDAMGCQTSIAERITHSGGHYLLAVKDNQPTLHADLQTTFDDALDTEPRPLDQPAPLPTESWSDTTKGHGRIEQRTVHVCRDFRWMTTAKRWSNLAFVARVQATRTDLRTDRSTTETRFFIGSDPDVSTERIASLIRRHWSIENELHWVLDMAFSEDAARHRTRNCADNFATLRHFALNLVKNMQDRKLGVANTRKHLGWDRRLLFQLLTGKPG